MASMAEAAAAPLPVAGEGLGRPGLWLVLGEWRAAPGRVLVAILAIAVGVALGFAVQLVNDAALASFAGAVRGASGAVDLRVVARTPAGFAEALYPRVARLPGVAAVSPVVELSGTIGRVRRPGEGRLTLIGIDPFRAAAVTPGLAGAPASARAAPALDNVLLTGPALAQTGVRPGQAVTIVAAGHAARFRVAGRLPGEGMAAMIDIAEAQWRYGRLGRLHRLDLRLAAGADPDAVARRLAAILPGDATLTTPAAEAERGNALSRAYRVNLGMLAMVALLTGGFLVFSAQSLSVARRRPQFALLRVLGLRQSALTRLVLAEGLVLGVIGSAIGLAAGFALARLVVGLVGGDLGGGYFGAARPDIAFPPLAAALFGAIGVGVAAVASLVPACEAARARPAIALKAGAEGEPSGAPRAWPGLVLMAAAGLAALAPPIAGLPIAGYGAMALLLAGGVAVMPALAHLLLAPVQARRWPVPIDLALQRLWGAPRGAAVALSGIVASTSLMVAMAVMVASFRGSVDAWLGQVLPADLYLHLEGAEGGGLDPAAQARLAAVPGVAAVRFQRALPLQLAPDRPPVQLSGQRLGPDGPEHLPVVARGVPPAGTVPVWVSEAMVWLYDARPGAVLLLPIGGRQVRVGVRGVWRDYARQFGAIVMDSNDFDQLTGDRTRTDAAISLASGADPGVVSGRLRAGLPPELAGQALIARPAEMRATALRLFDRSFAITYALELVAILIGLAGVAATFSGQTLARRREFGMLRHIGVTKGQLLAMLASEGGLLGLVGGVAGIALGLVMALVLVEVVNPQSFHWTMDLALPWGLLVTLFAALVLAAAGTAVLAGRRALSLDAVRAVREDW